MEIFMDPIIYPNNIFIRYAGIITRIAYSACFGTA